MEYKLDATLKVPDHIFVRKVDEFYVVLAPDYPNWLVLSEEEFQMFNFIKAGMTVKESLEKFFAEVCANKDHCLSVIRSLLTQMHEVSFWRDAESYAEEPIGSIVKRVHIVTTNGCNMRCTHCYMAAGKHSLSNLDLKKVLRLISELNKVYGKLEIVVSGGEPLTYNGFEDLLWGIRNNHVILFTNGSLIRENNVETIKKCCKEVQISMEGISELAYSKVRGEGSYQNVRHAIELIKKAKLRLVLAVTILPETVSDVSRNLLPFIKGLNYGNLEVRINDQIELEGNAAQLDVSILSKQSTQDMIIDLVRQLRSLGCSAQRNDIRNVRYTNCGIGTCVFVNHDGRVFPCHKLSSYSFSLEDPVERIIKEFDQININTSNELIPKCHSCELRYICSGGCRIRHFMDTGDMLKVTCNEDFKISKYRRLIKEFLMFQKSCQR